MCRTVGKLRFPGGKSCIRLIQFFLVGEVINPTLYRQSLLAPFTILFVLQLYLWPESLCAGPSLEMLIGQAHVLCEARCGHEPRK